MRGTSASCIATLGSDAERRRRQAELLDRRAHGSHVGRRRDHERAGRELDALRREALVGDLHRHVPQLVAEGDHVVRAVVRDRQAGRARSRHLALASAASFTGVVSTPRIALSLISFTSTSIASPIVQPLSS